MLPRLPTETSRGSVLAKKLPKGSRVQLSFDIERHDRYARTLAALTLQGELINESLVASGHTKAMKVNPNLKYYGQLRAAQKQAQQDLVGIFDPAMGCR